MTNLTTRIIIKRNHRQGSRVKLVFVNVLVLKMTDDGGQGHKIRRKTTHPDRFYIVGSNRHPRQKRALVEQTRRTVSLRPSTPFIPILLKLQRSESYNLPSKLLVSAIKILTSANI